MSHFIPGELAIPWRLGQYEGGQSSYALSSILKGAGIVVAHVD